MIPLTERFLSDAGGWAALKEARALLAAGRVLEASYQPPMLSGRVRGGETEYRSGLRISSKTDVENLCTCPDSRRRAVVCAHSLAVGLAVLAPAAPAPVKAPLPPPPTPKAPESAQIPFRLDEGDPVTLHVILPPNFPSVWPKDNLMVCLEATIGGQRKPLAALPPSRTYQCDPADFRLIQKYLALTGGKLAGMATLKRGEFLALLAELSNHPRVTFGKSTAAQISSETQRAVLQVDSTEAGVKLHLSPPPAGQLRLVGPASVWELTGAAFSPVVTTLPPTYLRLFEAPVQIPSEAAEPFLARELPMLAGHFEVAGEVSTASGPVEIPEPRFAALFEGSLNQLTARLEAIYSERKITLDASGAIMARFVRNRAAEQAAIARLTEAGFSAPDAKGDLVMKGENRTLPFFASILPRLQRDWKVTIGERFTHVTGQVERIEPRMEVKGSGEQWFDLTYELATAKGDRYSGSDIQRLLQAGQNHLKKKNGGFVVFDNALLDEFEHLLRESAPRQVQPGVYRMDRRQAGTLDAFSQDHQVAIRGESRWRQWAQGSRDLEKLTPVPLGSLEGTLRPYQKHGVFWMNFLARNGFGGILADEMGLGKTVQALAFLRTLSGQGPSLIVCPSSLVWNWAAEAARWTPAARILTLSGAERAGDFHRIKESDLVVTSYPLLRRDIEHLREFDFVAVLLDEAQHIKNPDSQNAQSATRLRSRYRFALTGTPVENTIRDVWSLMHFLMPGYLGQKSDFRDTYERPVQADPSGPEAQRLRRRIQPFLLRRTKKTVATELPEKLEQVTYCELTKSQKELYGKLAAAARNQIADLSSEKDGGRARMLALTALLRLRQAACDLRLLQPEDPSPEEVSGKLDLLKELLEEVVDGGHRVLIFSQFVTMLGFIRERLKADGVDFCYLDGSTKDRQAEVTRFQAGQVPVFLISLKAGGTGLNLTAADTVIHFDPWWNPAVEAQATDRAHRIGQKKVVTSYKLIARDTVEEKILALQAKKRAIVDAAVDGEQPLMEGLSIDEITALMA